MTPSAPLTRAAIVAAAVAHVDGGSLGSISTRGLAAELGVTPMALYRHVRNKDDLLVAVVDVLLERLGVPEPGRDWRAWLEALALGLRRLLVEHPVAVAVFSRAPVTTPAARRRLNAAVEVLGQAGFSRDGAVRAYAAVHTYTVGFCALEAARYSGAVGPLPGSVDDESMLIGTFVSDDQFTHGLGALLRGLSPET